MGIKEVALLEQREGVQHYEYKPKLNLLHQERNVLCRFQGVFLTKISFFRKTWSATSALSRWRSGHQPVHCTHSWLTRCATLPELASPFLVQTCSGRWRSRAQFVSGQMLTMGRLSPTSRMNGSQFPESCINLPPINVYVWGNVDSFSFCFFSYITCSIQLIAL